MKTLIAIAGCHARRAQSDAQRQTWVRDVRDAEVRFFAGGPGDSWPQSGEVWLDCPDGYWERREKVLAMIRWTLARGFDYLWKVDDDVYLRPERLLAIPPHDYCGCAVDFNQGPTKACIGWLYGLSRHSMELLLEPDTSHLPYWDDYRLLAGPGAGSIHEDVWVGLRLLEFGILPVQLAGFGGLIRCTHCHGEPNGWDHQEPPRPDNKVMASCEYTPTQMREIHRAFRPS